VHSILRFFVVIDMDGSFPMRDLESWFMSYKVFKNSVLVWACSQPLPVQQNLPRLPMSKRVREGRVA
jgi:hypothetical protein